MRDTILVVVAVILSAAVALLAAGLVEVYAELQQVRSVLHMQDQPSRLHLPTLGREVAELLPEPPDPLRADDYVLVLSNSCAVCHTIGADLAHTRPAWAGDLAVLVASETEQAGQAFMADVGLRLPRMHIDHLGRSAKRLGVENSPTVIRIRGGRLDSAANLSSLRQLELFVSGRG